MWIRTHSFNNIKGLHKNVQQKSVTINLLNTKGTAHKLYMSILYTSNDPTQVFMPTLNDPFTNDWHGLLMHHIGDTPHLLKHKTAGLWCTNDAFKLCTIFRKYLWHWPKKDNNQTEF